MRRTQGFTLIEILIVVIILGILAAIVIPQFTEASSEARESTLVSNLQTLRSQIGLYKVQHNDDYPDVDNDSAGFEACLTQKTLIDGAVDAAGEYGPYMQNVPDNPFITNDALPLFRLDADTTAAGEGTAHWAFDPDTGNIWADDTGSTPAPDNTPHSDL